MPTKTKTYPGLCDSVCSDCIHKRRNNTDHPLCSVCKVRVDIRNKMAQDNKKLAWAAVHRFFRNYPEVSYYYPRDDAYHDAYVCLMRCCELHDPSGEAAFSTYAMQAMFNTLYRAKNRYVMKECSADSDSIRSNHADPSSGRDCELVDIVEHVHWAVRRLPKRLRQLIKFRLAGKTLPEIAKRWEITSQRAQQLYAEAREKLAELILPTERDSHVHDSLTPNGGSSSEVQGKASTSNRSRTIRRQLGKSSRSRGSVRKR